MMTNNNKAPVSKKNEKEKSNKQTTRKTYKTRFVGICQGHTCKRSKQCFLLFYTKQIR